MPSLTRSPVPPGLRIVACLPLGAIMLAALFAPAFAQSGGTAGARTDPAAIDAAVEAFTGARTGEIGGAIAPADSRLRLAACPAPLEADWHGAGQSTVRVQCPGPGGWRVFVALRMAGSSSLRGSSAADRNAPLVERGDPVTVMVRGRGFTVQQAGEAIEPGREGEWIGIRLAGRARAGRMGRRPEPVRARIVRPGLAVIPVGGERGSD
jgi:flagella basal body P-ring formation protein FlgA